MSKPDSNPKRDPLDENVDELLAQMAAGKVFGNYELVKDLHGKLFPTGLLKLLYRLKVVGPKTGRLVLYGVRKKFRTQRKYAALSLYLYAEINDSSRQLGYTQGELGWTLEDNAAVNTAIKVMGAKKYKTYRVFGKAIA